jgi:Xaa-Pro aminopeptidase
MAPLPVPTLAPLEFAGRLERLRSALGRAGVDSLVVTNLTNVRYLSGFAGSAAVLAVTPEHAVLTTDGRYRTQAAEQLAGAGVAEAIELVIGGVEAQREALAALLGRGDVGLEADSVTWTQATSWQERLGRELVATSGVVEELRQVKDAGELDRIRHAAAIADAALAGVLGELGSGLSEEAFGRLLDAAMFDLGAEGLSFETIVASGENSAKPHHHPGPRRIEHGDPVVVDFGAAFEGYRSDMTRTFVVGAEPTGELAEIFSVVARAQAAGTASVHPSMVAGEVDQVCRELIVEAGYGEQFEHSTGHGIGLDVHEPPWVASQGTAILEPGVVLTVEPGIYVAGIGGVRIEDTLVVTEVGAEPLTHFPKDPVA